MTTRVLILAGGQSEEHTVSLASAQCVLKAMEAAPTLSATLRVISRQGGLLDEAASLAAVQAGKEVATGGQGLEALIGAATQAQVVLPLLHGPLGEDGTLQGLLTLLGVPYVGCGVLASALCMDKPMAKEVLRASGLPQVPFVTLSRQAFADREERLVAHIVSQFPPPYFVKPANMGSSVGITQVAQADGLAAAIAHAGRFDRRIIVEAGLTQVRELEIGIIGNTELTTSPVGEICHDGRFYDYATKYTAGHSQMVIPARIPAAVAQQITELAVQTYRLLDCAGLARVDFFYTPQDGAVYVNEVNTLPGFTTFSMFPSLFGQAGVPYGALLERLTQLALERHKGQS
jgi:D-alanine-D-alanine ligase